MCIYVCTHTCMDCCVTDGEEGMDDGARKGGGESQGFVAITADSTSPLGKEEEEVEGNKRKEEMEGEGEEDKLSQLPESMREILVSLLQEKYECIYTFQCACVFRAHKVICKAVHNTCVCSMQRNLLLTVVQICTYYVRMLLFFVTPCSEDSVRLTVLDEVLQMVHNQVCI